MASLWTKFTDIFSRNKSGVVPQAPSGIGTTKYLREDGTWAEPPGAGGSSTIEGLEDVDISDPESGQGLIYNENTSKWENGDVASDMEEITYDYYLAHKAEIEASDKTYLVTGSRSTPSAAGGGVNIYSTEEQVVGKWIDGKPLYEKTWEFSSTITVQSNIWLDTSIKVSDFQFKDIIGAVGVNNTGTFWGSICAACQVNDYIRLTTFRPSGSISINYLVLQYTKTTDTPVSLVPYVYPSSSIKGLVADVGTQQVPFRFTYDQITQKYGYLDGADVFKPFGEGGGNKYSTTEHIVGTWINGKPLYEKTIDIGGLPNNDAKYIAHGISDLNNVIKLFGCAFNSSGTNMPLPYAHYQSNLSIVVFANNDNVEIQTATDRRSYSGYITIQYTKTTD